MTLKPIKTSQKVQSYPPLELFSTRQTVVHPKEFLIDPLSKRPPIYKSFTTPMILHPPKIATNVPRQTPHTSKEPFLTLAMTSSSSESSAAKQTMQTEVPATGSQPTLATYPTSLEKKAQVLLKIMQSYPYFKT